MYHTLTTSEQGLLKLYDECVRWGIHVEFVSRDGYPQDASLGSFKTKDNRVFVTCFIPRNESEIENTIDLLVRSQSAVEKEKQRILHLMGSPDFKTALLATQEYQRFNKYHNQNK